MEICKVCNAGIYEACLPSMLGDVSPTTALESRIFQKNKKIMVPCHEMVIKREYFSFV
jgi:hypothetical protein